MKKRSLLSGAVALATLTGLPLTAFAQDKPPLKIVVGFPPGGSADLLARLKPEVRDRISVAVAQAVRTPALRAKLIEQGDEPVGSTPAELAAAQTTDLKRWEAPIKAPGVQLD